MAPIRNTNHFETFPLSAGGTGYSGVVNTHFAPNSASRIDFRAKMEGVSEALQFSVVIE